MFVVADSNLFHGRIKIENPEITSLLSKLKILGWQFLMPEPSILELEKGAVDVFDRAFGDFKRGIKEFQKIMVKVDANHPTQADFLGDYRKRFTEFVSKNKIQIIPFPSTLPKVTDLFAAAVRKEPPFDRSGNSYRDVVIFYSVREFAEKNKDKHTYFITNDQNFAEAADQVTTKNVTCGSVEKIIEIVDAKLSAAYRERENRLKEEIMTCLSENKSNIEPFIDGAVDFEFNIDYSERLLSIDAFRLMEIVEIESLAETEGKSPTFSALILGDVIYKVETTRGQKESKLAALKQMQNKPTKVGESVASIGLFGQYISSETVLTSAFNMSDTGGMFDRIVETRTKYVLIELEGQATLKNDHVSGYDLRAADLSAGSPFRFIDLAGNIRSVPLPKEPWSHE